MHGLLIASFIIGYLLIIFEHYLKLDKTIPALLAGMVGWVLISTLHIPLISTEGHSTSVTNTVLHHLANVSEILIFLIGAMTIVEVIDAHHGFSLLTNRIQTRKKTQLLWIVSWITFVLSALLDNLTTTIIMISLLRKLINEKSQRIWYVGFVILAANAGGAWSPIGDVTTTMLWIAEKVTTLELIKNLIIPSIISLVIPLLVVKFYDPFQGFLSNKTSDHADINTEEIRNGKIMLISGSIGLLFVPIFKTLTHLAPWMGMMISLSIIWLISEIINPDMFSNEIKQNRYSIKKALSRIEMPSVLFFLGILMAISSLESTGLLHQLASKLDNMIPSRNAVATLIGILSAVIDNVPLVAACIGMYNDAVDSTMWHFVAFAAGTGGSMLIIGSAAGVAAMGLEKIDFLWYLKRIGLLAFIGYISGCLALAIITQIA